MSEAKSLPDDGSCALDRIEDNPDERIATLRTRRPPDDEVETQTTIFSALNNENRLRILSVLRESECCVCELQVVLDAPQSTVATHLRTLKDAGLVKSRKQGKWNYYRIADTAALELLDLAAAIREAE